MTGYLKSWRRYTWQLKSSARFSIRRTSSESINYHTRRQAIGRFNSPTRCRHAAHFVPPYVVRSAWCAAERTIRFDRIYIICRTPLLLMMMMTMIGLKGGREASIPNWTLALPHQTFVFIGTFTQGGRRMVGRDASPWSFTTRALWIKH